MYGRNSGFPKIGLIDCEWSVRSFVPVATETYWHSDRAEAVAVAGPVWVCMTVWARYKVDNTSATVCLCECVQSCANRCVLLIGSINVAQADFY